MKQLPESFCIAREGRTPETCPRWKRFIDNLNSIKNPTIALFDGNAEDYYGIRDKERDCHTYPFGQLLNLDQFEEIMGWKESENKFPESFFCKVYNENKERIAKISTAISSIQSGFNIHSPATFVGKHGGRFFWSQNFAVIYNFTEITIDELESLLGIKTEWQPKPGEMVQVSNDGTWNEERVEFIVFAEKSEHPYVVYWPVINKPLAWKYCRPAPKVTTYSRSEAIKLLSQHTGKPESEIEITD